jgi:hypothetical protein
VSTGTETENDFEMEQRVRLTVLEVLYTRKRMDPDAAGLSPYDMEKLIGRPREHLAFTFWYLTQKKYLVRSDTSMLLISADGVEFLENNYRENVQRRRLTAGPRLRDWRPERRCTPSCRISGTRFEP